MCLSGYKMMVEVIFRTAQIHLELQFLCRTTHKKAPYCCYGNRAAGSKPNLKLFNEIN